MLPRPQGLVRRVINGTDWKKRIPPAPHLTHTHPEIQELLATPSWSVRSLLPPEKTETETADSPAEPEITVDKLHHLLRLSALPLPKTQAEESKLLSTLRSQIHFVRAIQSVDTTDVEPLVAIRDETQEAIDEQTVKLEHLQPWLDTEEHVGKNGTVRRRKLERQRGEDGHLKSGLMDWDAFDLGEGSDERKKAGQGGWFVVKKNKSSSQAQAQDGVDRRTTAPAEDDTG